MKQCVTGGRTKEGTSCQSCGGPLAPKVRAGGKPRKFCSKKCLLLRRRNGSDRTTACRRCGVTFGSVPWRKGPLPWYCSNECRDRSGDQENCCERCGSSFRGFAGKKFCSRRCRWPSQLSDPAECVACGLSFLRTRHNSKCCSPACLDAKRKRDAAAAGKRSRQRARSCQCLCCGKPFRKKNTGRNAGKYCSRDCAFEARRLRLPCAIVNRRPGASLDAQLAVWFHSWGTDADEPANVGSRRGGHKYRCHLYGCHYEPVSARAILERDGWVCRLCGRPLKRQFSEGGGWNASPGSPTIDHIVPLSYGPDGPGHRPSNLQACCWECNMKKGNKLQTPLRLTMPHA